MYHVQPLKEGEGRVAISLKGRSGVTHVFERADFGQPDGLPGLPHSVTEVNEFDVIGLYLRMYDAGVKRGRIVGPSFSEKAKRLAEEYSVSVERGQAGPARG